MQNNNKTHRVDPDKNILETNGETDRWTNEQDSFRRDEGLIMFFKNLRIRYS